MNEKTEIPSNFKKFMENVQEFINTHSKIFISESFSKFQNFFHCSLQKLHSVEEILSFFKPNFSKRPKWLKSKKTNVFFWVLFYYSLLKNLPLENYSLNVFENFVLIYIH